mmetsp:Transcript_122406/g.341170  ORF Transcript_122406/g.341170 Transcript_122406/m.341170 type:complete len:215 (-) Transcript_122406:117-761(-)
MHCWAFSAASSSWQPPRSVRICPSSSSCCRLTLEISSAPACSKAFMRQSSSSQPRCVSPARSHCTQASQRPTASCTLRKPGSWKDSSVFHASSAGQTLNSLGSFSCQRRGSSAEGGSCPIGFAASLCKEARTLACPPSADAASEAASANSRPGGEELAAAALASRTSNAAEALPPHPRKAAGAVGGRGVLGVASLLDAYPFSGACRTLSNASRD